MRKLILITMTIIAVLALSPAAFAAEFELDPMHSQIGFKITHMVIAKVRGTFDNYTASFVLDGNNKLVSARADIDVASINTRIEKRDADLRSTNFFDVEKFPKMTFVSKSVVAGPGGNYVVKGDMTMRGITKEITLTGTIVGPIKDPWGNIRMGFEVEGMLNRKDFGLTWNEVLETGGLLVGDDVTLVIEGEGILKQ